MLKKHLLISILKMVVLLNIFVETEINSDQLNASLLNKSINFFLKINYFCSCSKAHIFCKKKISFVQPMQCAYLHTEFCKVKF